MFEVRTDDDGLHMAVCVHLVGSDHGIGSDEDVLVDDHATAENGRWIDKGAAVNDREIAAWVLADHWVGDPVFMADTD